MRPPFSEAAKARGCAGVDTGTRFGFRPGNCRIDGRTRLLMSRSMDVESVCRRLVGQGQRVGPIGRDRRDRYDHFDHFDRRDHFDHS